MTGINSKLILFAFGVLAVLILAYANHFHNGFHFDDMHAIVNNLAIRDLSNIPQYFTDPRMFSSDPSHWGIRSLVTLSLAIDYAFGGLDPFFFQLSTFIWHTGLSFLLYFIYRRLLSKTFGPARASWVAAIAASWFALHTANAETINYIISRSDVLSTFMIALSFFVFVTFPSKRKYCFYLVPAFIGVFAKETVPMLVVILFFYILLFEKQLSVGSLFRKTGFSAIGNTLWQLLPLLIVVVITQVYTLSRIAGIPGITNPPLYYMLTQSWVWLHYFIAFFLPFNLSADSDWTVIRHLFDERIIAGLAFVAGLVIAIFKTSAKEETRPVALGLIWFSAALLPTSLAPFAEVTNDHRMYFPFAGLAFSVVTYCAVLWKRNSTRITSIPWNFIVPALVVCVLGLNAYGVYKRDQVWKNEETLWRDVTVKSPLNGRGLMNYALSELNAGKYDTAVVYFDKAKPMLPYYPTLYINLGVLNDRLKNYKLADENFDYALTLAPNDVDSYTYYAWYLQEHMRYPEAREIAEKALAINSRSELALTVLLSVYDKLNLWPQLQLTAQTLLKLVPGNPGAATELSLAEKNIKAVKKGLQPDTHPLTADDYLNLSLTYYNTGYYDKCIEACREAIKLKPGYADAWNNIGAAYNKLKNWDKSAEACKKALITDPSNKLAAGNLKLAETHTLLP